MSNNNAKQVKQKENEKNKIIEAINSLNSTLKLWKNKKNYSLFVSLVAIIVSSSGWLVFFYTNNINQPSINAKVFQVMQGKMIDPENSTKTISVFTFYICLTNIGHYPMEVLNYDIQVNQGNGFKKLDRLYNIQNINPIFTSDLYNIDLTNLPDKLIYLNHNSISYGEARHGFILFGSREETMNISKIIEYKITITDVYKNTYTTITIPDEFINILDLNDIADVQIIKK